MVFLFSKSGRAAWKACSSVGHTKVKSFGYQNNKTLLCLLTASSNTLIFKSSPISDIASMLTLGNFLPTIAIIILVLMFFSGAKVRQLNFKNKDAGLIRHT